MMHEANTTLSHPEETVIWRELLERRARLEAAAARSDGDQISDLLNTVDEALHRLEHGEFGVCLVCDEPVEPQVLLNDPLARVCLECLSPGQRRALEHDLELAASIQTRLLPDRDFSSDGWEGHYVYQPHGSVSGDFCDVIPDGDATLILLGDVSGKGVSAALLMSHLSAILRGLAGSGLPLIEILDRANRLFCSVIPAGSFATLVAARLQPDGDIELVNAGHVPPIIQNGRVDRLPPDGVPLGLFCQSSYTSQRLRLAMGDRLVLVTDGLVESRNAGDREYGLEGLSAVVESYPRDTPPELAKRLLKDAASFRAGRPADDDTTLMIISRTS